MATKVNVVVEEQEWLKEWVVPYRIDDKWQLYHVASGELIAGEYEEIRAPTNTGIAFVMLERKWGLLGIKTTLKTEFIFPCLYRFLGDFSEGLACASENGNGLIGFINHLGKEILPFHYSGASKFQEGLASVRIDKEKFFIDKTGKRLFDRPDGCISGFYDGMASFAKEIGTFRNESIFHYGFIDNTGKEVIPCIYEDLNYFSEGLAAVKNEKKKGGLFGFVDKTGKEIIPFIYDRADPFDNGLATVKKDGFWGSIDRTGKEVLPFIFNSPYGFDEGLATVKIAGKKGFMDKTGKTVIPCQYDTAHGFSNGTAEVSKNKLYGFINKEGQEVVPCIYKHVKERTTEFALVEKVRTKEIGWIDMENNQYWGKNGKMLKKKKTTKI